MKQRQKRPKEILHHLFFSIGAASFLSVLLIILIKANYSLYTRNDKARENKETLQHELDMLTERKQSLVAMLGKIDTEKGQEIALRRRFDMGKDGEELIVIIDSQNPSIPSHADDGGFWKQLSSYIPFLSR